MYDVILNMFGNIENLNYIEYLFQIIQLILTLITFLTVFMSVHYQENIVKLQRAEMEIKAHVELEKVRNLLYEYIYIIDDAVNRYESILKIFDFFSMGILYISIICAFIYSIYLPIGAIILIWSIELIFLLAIYFVSKKLHCNRKVEIKKFFDYKKSNILYNDLLNIKPKIRIIIPKQEQKYIVEITLPYYFYNFRCALKMSNMNDCLEILVKGEDREEINKGDLLEKYIIKSTFKGDFKYIDGEVLFFIQCNENWKTYNTKTKIEEDDQCKIIEVTTENIENYKQISPITVSALNEMNNNIKINK